MCAHYRAWGQHHVIAQKSTIQTYLNSYWGHEFCIFLSFELVSVSIVTFCCCFYFFWIEKVIDIHCLTVYATQPSLQMISFVTLQSLGTRKNVWEGKPNRDRDDSIIAIKLDYCSLKTVVKLCVQPPIKFKWTSTWFSFNVAEIHSRVYA